MIRAVPAEYAKHYLNVMVGSWVFNSLITFLIHNALLSPFGFLLLTLITDWCWWFTYKRSKL